MRVGVDTAAPPRAELPWSYKWDRILGRSVGGLIWVAVLAVAGALASLLMYRATVEKSPPFPLQYAPPEGIGPVQSEYIRTESVSKNALTATLFYLADRGLIEMRQTGKDKWKLRNIAKAGAWADVDPVSVEVASALKVLQARARSSTPAAV